MFSDMKFMSEWKIYLLNIDFACARMTLDYNHYYAITVPWGKSGIIKEDIRLNRFYKRMALLLTVVVLLVATQPAVLAAGKVKFTQVDEVVYATTAVNVRRDPSTSRTPISYLTYGEAVRRIGIGSNGWSKVIYNGKEAYVFSKYLTTTKPSNYVAQIDTAELTRQISIANGLNSNAYTAESWEALEKALKPAEKALKGNDQKAVDKAAAELKEAIAALVRMDYSSLETVLADVEAFLNAHPDSEAWMSLAEAVNEGKKLLASGDQAASDEAAARISQLLDQVMAIENQQQEPEVIIQEVPVEVPPTDDFCNIPSHRVWPVVFCISAALNVAMAAVILVYISRKKRNQHDDTPLVDYDIFDDSI